MIINSFNFQQTIDQMNIKNFALLSSIVAGSSLMLTLGAQAANLGTLISTGGTLTAGNVLYSNFQEAGAGPINTSYDTIQVNAKVFTPTPGGFTEENDLGFTLSATAESNQTVDIPLTYTVTALNGQLIGGINNRLTGFGTNDTGKVVISESAYDAVTGQAYGNLVNIQPSNGNNLFVSTTLVPPTKSITLTKNINVSGGSGAMGQAHLSAFDNSVELVPEPMTVAGGGLALGLGFLVRRKTRVSK